MMAAVPRQQTAAGRMPLLDAVKGVACLLIVGHHLVRYGPLADGAAPLAPGLFDWLSQDGRLAVQVFLVRAGFLAAASLAPTGLMRSDRPAMHMLLHRYGRLVMPYLAALKMQRGGGGCRAALAPRRRGARRAEPAPTHRARVAFAGPAGLRGLVGRRLVRGHRLPAVCAGHRGVRSRGPGAAALEPVDHTCPLAGRGAGGGAGRGLAARVQPAAIARHHGGVFLRCLRIGLAGLLDRSRYPPERLAICRRTAGAARPCGAGDGMAQPHRGRAGHGTRRGAGTATGLAVPEALACMGKCLRCCDWGGSLIRCS